MCDRQPNYFAIITADVRFNERLSANAKLLYGEITALSNKKGYCYATNSYLADLYKTSKQSVINWIKQLEEEGYIKIEIVKNEKNAIEERRIYVNICPKKEMNEDEDKMNADEEKNTVETTDYPSQKNLTTPSQKILTTLVKKI